MELISGFGIIIFFGVALLIFVAIMGIIFYGQSFGAEQKKDAWRAFAAAHNLQFIAGQFPSGAQVVGAYRDYELTLETVRVGEDHGLNTRLALETGRQIDRTGPAVQISQTSQMDQAGQIRPAQSSSQQPLPDRLLTETEVMEMLLPAGLAHDLKGEVRIEAYRRTIYYEQSGLEADEDYLWFLLDLLANLVAAYPAIVTLGGEAVPVLQKLAAGEIKGLQPLASSLLEDIIADTKRRLRPLSPELLCPYCLRRYQARGDHLAVYYGCRSCGQSRRFLRGEAIAVLDEEMETAVVEQDGHLWINWLKWGQLFDFDEIKIIKATDEAVERLAMQVGNDTDPKRQPLYQQMVCTISAGCSLSQNTWRVLQKTFGTVTVEELGR